MRRLMIVLVIAAGLVASAEAAYLRGRGEIGPDLVGAGTGRGGEEMGGLR